MKDRILEIIQYEYNTSGGYITIKFESGYTTRRKFNNKVSDGSKVCDLSGKIIPNLLPYISVSIKRKGYPTYNISQIEVNNALLRKTDAVVEEHLDLEKALVQYSSRLFQERESLDDEDAGLRKALRELKFKKSILGQKTAATNHLLELITKNKEK